MWDNFISFQPIKSTKEVNFSASPETQAKSPRKIRRFEAARSGQYGPGSSNQTRRSRKCLGRQVQPVTVSTRRVPDTIQIYQQLQQARQAAGIGSHSIIGITDADGSDGQVGTCEQDSKPETVPLVLPPSSPSPRPPATDTADPDDNRLCTVQTLVDNERAAKRARETLVKREIAQLRQHNTVPPVAVLTRAWSNGGSRQFFAGGQLSGASP